MARTVTPTEVNQLARLGAAVRLQQLEQEAAAIRKMFPGLGRGEPAPRAEPEAAPRKGKPRRKSRMSAAARQAARDRMKAYWAKKKGEAAPANGGSASIEAADRPARKARGRRAARKRTSVKKG